MVIERIRMSDPEQGDYIMDAIQEMTLNGDAFVSREHLFDRSKLSVKKLTWDCFSYDLTYLFKKNRLCQIGQRIYCTRTLRYEQALADILARLSKNNDLYAPELPDPLTLGEITLDTTQREAISMALSHRLSVILGGAGTGKTTLLSGLVQHNPNQGFGSEVLCAPTGKAACNLTQRTGLPARTVHSALSKTPDDDFLQPVNWYSVRLVVVDEASMLSLELLAGILNVVRSDCRVVLVGDPNQLLSVGSGNVLPDLLALGFPSVKLTCCHRQDEDATALKSNVIGFHNCTTSADLKQDDSFQFIPMYDELEIQKFIAQEGAKRYRNDESVQVLSPYNSAHKLSVDELNLVLRQLVNPPTEGKNFVEFEGRKFYTEDRVMITRNDWDRYVCNGQIGDMVVFPKENQSPVYGVCTGSYCPTWIAPQGLCDLTHAYAITVHKSQGSEFDTVIIPLHKCFTKLMYRNLLYTAISRAKKKVILVGDPDTLEHALRTPAPTRRSVLVAQTNMKTCRVIRRIGDIA